MPFRNLVELYKKFLRWSWSTLQHLHFWGYCTVSFPFQNPFLQITAKVSKVTKSVQGILTFIFVKLSEKASSFVKIIICRRPRRRRCICGTRSKPPFWVWDSFTRRKQHGKFDQIVYGMKLSLCHKDKGIYVPSQQEFLRIVKTAIFSYISKS